MLTHVHGTASFVVCPFCWNDWSAFRFKSIHGPMRRHKTPPIMPTANATRAKDEKHERQETDSFFTTAFISYWRLKKGHLLSCQVSNCVTTCDVHFVTRGRVRFVDGRKWPSQKVRKQQPQHPPRRSERECEGRGTLCTRHKVTNIYQYHLCPSI